MKLVGVVFVFLGVSLMGLSGLEKVLVFAAFTSFNPNSATQMNFIIDAMPPYIWGITNVTFWFGLIFFIGGLIGCVISFKEEMKTFLKKTSEYIK